jgi:hypothetical protein
MTEHERSDSGLSQDLLEVARRMTDGSVSPRRHAASRARLFDLCAALPRRGRTRVAIALVAAGLATSGGALGFARVARIHRQLAAPASSPTAKMETQTETLGEDASTSTTNDDGAEGDLAMAMAADMLNKSKSDGDGDGDKKSDDKSDGPKPPLTINTTPDYARVFWDNRRLEGSPATLSDLPDGKPHVLRVEAPGYETKTQRVTTGPEVDEISVDLQPFPIEIGQLSASAPIGDADPVIENLRKPLRECFDHDLPANPNLTGSVTLSLDLFLEGVVTGATAEDVHGLSPRVVTCLQGVVKGAEFSTGGKPAKLRVPIAFRGHR